MDLNGDLIEAARAGDYQRCEMLLDLGAEVGAVDDKGETPLLAAIDGAAGTNGRWSYAALFAVEALLKCGADTAACDYLGVTPLMRAAVLGVHNIVSLLIRHGADPLKHDLAGRRASDYATNWDCARALLIAEQATLHRLSAGAEVIVIEKPCRFCNKVRSEI